MGQKQGLGKDSRNNKGEGSVESRDPTMSFKMASYS